MSSERAVGVPDLLTDEEICALLRISRSTLLRHLKHGPPASMKPEQADLRRIRRINVGGERRWVRESVMSWLRGEQP